MRLLDKALIVLLTQVIIACNHDDNSTPAKTFSTSFESVDEFSQFYIVPQDYKGTASHDLTSELVHSGNYAHKGWIYGTNPDSTPTVNNNHRGYPTVQLYKTEQGAFRTPVMIEFWVWLNMQFQPGEWFSFATLDHSRSDIWDPVLVNLSDQGIVHLMHVPNNGEQLHDFQTDNITLPMNQWVKLSICLHFDQENGYAKVWQDGQLVSSAQVRSGNGELTQAHFGLYAPPSINGGEIYNDDLVIKESDCL